MDGNKWKLEYFMCNVRREELSLGSKDRFRMG